MGQDGIRNAVKQSNAMVMKSSKNNSFGAKPTAHNGLVGGSSPPGPTNVSTRNFSAEGIVESDRPKNRPRLNFGFVLNRWRRSTRLRIWGSAVRIRSGAPLNQGFKRNAVLIARQSHGTEIRWCQNAMTRASEEGSGRCAATSRSDRACGTSWISGMLCGHKIRLPTGTDHGGSLGLPDPSPAKWSELNYVFWYQGRTA